MKSLVWFRNDLRVEDNTSLKEACLNSEKVIAVYCFDPRHFTNTRYGFKKTERFRAQFLIECITDLRASLAANNISLIVRFDTPERVVPKLVQTHEITDIFCQLEWTSEECAVSNSLKASLDGIVWHESYDQFLFHPSDIPFAEFSLIPEVFTEFRKICESKSIVRKPVHSKSMATDNLLPEVSSIPCLSDLELNEFSQHPHTAFPFTGGEASAKQRLSDYFFNTQKLSFYKQTRNGLLGSEYSSKFSPWLAHGAISARTIYHQVERYESEVIKNEDTYWLIFELIWRDYFKYISLKHGNKIFMLDGIRGRRYQWHSSPDLFEQWIEGKGSEPFVNANMIELKHTGFMSNRGRQNVASFWAKELCQDWRIGAAYFESMLIDYDVHSNYGNWLYSAGVGNDPRDRKFNIQGQAERYDSRGEYQRLWLSL